MSWLIAGGAVALGLLALLPFAVFPIEMLANLRPQLAALCLLLAVSAFGVGRAGMGLVLGVLAVLLLAGAPALFSRPGPRPTGPALTVVWANIFKDPLVARRVARLVREQDADVVVVGEPLRTWRRSRGCSPTIRIGSEMSRVDMAC